MRRVVEFEAFRNLVEMIVMRLIDAFIHNPDVNIFVVLDSDADQPTEWDVAPIDGSVLTESTDHDFFIVKAKNIRPDGSISDCHIDICLPERISDYAYFLRGDQIDCHHHHECDGEVICAIPIDCCGNYELFYSKIAPDIGIEILKQALVASPHHCCVAEDLGYILRDECRFAEAAEMFQISADAEPSSYFIYGELADCYRELGQTDKASKYRALFEREC